MSEETIEYTGGCFCSKVHYQVLGKPIQVTHCHYSMRYWACGAHARDLGHLQESKFFIHASAHHQGLNHQLRQSVVFANTAAHRSRLREPRDRSSSM